MDTKQRTRPSANSQRKGQSTAKRKKKKSVMTKLLGGTRKKPAKRPEVRRTRDNAPQNTRTAPRTPEEEARRREAARRAAQREREAMAAQSQRRTIAEQGIPEEVFNTSQQTQKRTRTPEQAKRDAIRKRSAKRSKERAEEAQKAKNRPAVAYTQPLPFNLNRMLLQLAVVIAVVLAVVIGLSVFFKVDKVMVYGNDAYSAWTIQEASGIEGGENLLTFGRPRACGKIITSLPYVKDVRIGIKLPDTVNIYIEEFDVAYAIESSDGSWWLMTSTGKLTEQIDTARSGSYTRIKGVTLDSPIEGKQAVAKEELIIEPEGATQAPESTESTESTEPTDATSPVVTVSANDRLQAALLILSSLEANDIVGEVSSFDVTSLTNLEMMYGTRYQVKLGSTSDMDYKISCMKQSVAQLNEYQTGILDISFTTWPDQVGYTPLG